MEKGTLFVLSADGRPERSEDRYGTDWQISTERAEWFHLEGIEATRITEQRRVWRFLPVGDERLQEPALLGSRLGPASAK